MGATIHYSRNQLLIALCNVGVILIYYPDDCFGKRVSATDKVKLFGIGKEKVKLSDRFRLAFRNVGRDKHYNFSLFRSTNVIAGKNLIG